MPDHVLRAHPFVVAALLKLYRDSKDIGDDSGSEEEGEDVEDSSSLSEDANIIQNRRSAFVVNDLAQLGRTVFTASKALQSAGIVQRRLTSVAGRKHGTSKVAKVLYFMHAVPYAIGKELNTWVAVPKPREISTSTLFVGIKEQLANVCESAML